MANSVKLRQKRRRFKFFLLGVLALMLLVAGDYFLYPRCSPMTGRSLNHGENGLWLRYTWYFGEKTTTDLASLVRHVRVGQIRYLYCHVRYIQADGRLRFRKPDAARQLVRRLHQADPSVKVIAWVYAGNLPGENHVDLTQRAVRRAMVDEAVWLVNACGFDGVQWDYEICRDGDLGHVALIEETRATLPRHAVLSVCTPMWYPFPFTGVYGWKEAYFARIAASCDQLVVMGYDSAFYLPRAYVWLISQQAIRVTRAAALGNPRCRVLIGVPTYKKGGLSHHAHAENIRMALKGVRLATRAPDFNESAFSGVAIFADYTTSEKEWAAYRALW